MNAKYVVLQYIICYHYNSFFFFSSIASSRLIIG